MKMSDFDNFSKAIQRKFFRTKEKVLESLGKADKTTDGDFDSLAATFNEQYATANKLLRAFRNYSSQVKGMSVASKNMHQAVSEAYEPNWDGAENFAVQTEQLNKIWDDHFAKVSETIQFHIVSYVARFPELKNKIAKRGRKLLDYDRARHKLDALEKSKKRDEYKITTATRELNAAQTIYETINNELFEELPVLYNSRIPLLSNYFSMFLRTEASFGEDVTKIKRQMAELTAGLLKEQNLIASRAALGTLRAKTLPRREPPKMVPASDKKGRYSPQLAARGIQVRNTDKGATLPPKPPSPKVPPFIYQPPPPKEPAPRPPSSVSPSSPLYSTIGLPKATTAPQKPPQPNFGFSTSQTTTVQNPAQANSPLSSSSSPPPVPPPPSCFSTNGFSSPPPQQQQPLSSSPLPPQPQLQVNTKNIISYVPELTPLSGHTQVVVEHDNPFEADLRAESGMDQSDLSKAAATAVAEAGTNAGEAAAAAADAARNLLGKVENTANLNVEKLSKAGEEATAQHGVTVHYSNQVGEAAAAAVADAATTVGQLQASDASSGKVAGVLNNDVSKKVDDEVEKAKEGVSEVGKTITENIDIVAGQMAAAASTTVDGVVNAALSAVGGSVVAGSEVKEGQTGAINLPSNRFLYKVQATHSYSAADTDEMTLDAGDVIYVLPINDKDFEDEGWALGLKQKDGVKGMFPVNFTRKIVD